MRTQRQREVEYVAEDIQLESCVLAFEPTLSGQPPGQMPTLSWQHYHTAPYWCSVKPEATHGLIALC